MKKIRFFFYVFILLCAGLAGCRDEFPTNGKWDNTSLKVYFNPIRLSMGNDIYYAQNKYDDYWYGVYTPNSEIVFFDAVFGEGGVVLNFRLNNSKILATTKSSRGSKDATYDKTGTHCTLSSFYVWADGYDNTTFMSQELNIQIYSGPFKNNAGQQGNLYWTKKMLATDYDRQDIWIDELKEEATFNAGKLQSVAAFKLISSSSGSSGGGGGGGSISGSGGSGGRPPLPNGMDYALDNGNLYTLDNSHLYITNNTNLYVNDNTSSVLVDAHYRTDVAASASAAAAQEGVLLVYSRATANTQILQ